METSMNIHPDPLISLLRIEGFAVGLAAIALYSVTGQSWLLFAIFILAPDFAMAGYLLGNRIGAICYNCTHTYIAPIILAGVSWLLADSMAVDLVIIWVAHIGFDRAFGYGLKRQSGFKSTHLSKNATV
tara:strand:- start:1661 stop:2047 length:387 start_codon:yes stop_codon:yes gene_type:complete